jgi:hypothetical protein
MVDTVVGFMSGNSVDIREKLKSRRGSFMIMMTEVEKSCAAIVRISVPHFDAIQSLFSGLPSGIQSLRCSEQEIRR